MPINESTASSSRTVIRVRRLLDHDTVDFAYGRGVVAHLPTEIQDLADGTRVVEWPAIERRITIRRESSDERKERVLGNVIESQPLESGLRWVSDRMQPLQPGECVVTTIDEDTRIRYASEEDLWRDVHARAENARAVARGIREADATDPDATEATAEAASDAVEFMGDERGPAPDSPAKRRAMLAEAWIVRSTATSIGDEIEDMKVRSVPKFGEADSRPIDSLGRRNIGAQAVRARRTGPVGTL